MLNLSQLTNATNTPAATNNNIPNTQSTNFYTADADLAYLLQRHLSTADYERAQPILTDMGAVAAQQMDALAEPANREGPVLHQFDKLGNRVDDVIFHPAYHELERITYEQFAIAACCHRYLAVPSTGPLAMKQPLARASVQKDALAVPSTGPLAMKLFAVRW